MNNHERQIIEKLEAISVTQARKEIITGKFGDIGSPNHSIASTWLLSKESNLREEREAEMLSINRKALRISYWAIAIAITAIIFSTATAIIIALIENK